MFQNCFILAFCDLVILPRWSVTFFQSSTPITLAFQAQEVKTDGCDEAPPVLPSPTNALRQPMMPRSTRSVRSTVHAANWGPSVSNALATSIPIRPATAPQRPMGYQKPNLEMNVDDLPCIPQATLETPTNAQRQPMMSRSSRSARHQVLIADAENSTPTVYAGTPKPRGLTLTALDTDLDTSSTLKLSGMATPTNLDRKNAQMSLQMGTPSFRGSATPSGVLRVPPLPTGSGIRPG